MKKHIFQTLFLQNKALLIFLTTFTPLLWLTPLSASATATERDQAKKLYSSLTGNTANKALANHYEQMIRSGQIKEAAREIIESNSGFYNVTLKNLFTSMSNEGGTNLADFNDMTALLIGATRDEIDFFRVFYDDILYQFDGELITNNTEDLPKRYQKYQRTNDWLYLRALDLAVPMYNRTKNDMYRIAEQGTVPLGNRDYFKMTSQKTFTTREPAAIAGIFSTRSWAEAYYEAGTNRAPFAYFARNFLCKEMEELSDTTIPDFRVRRDVDRTPGGDSSTYKTYCVGCHAGQDALAGAFAYYDFVDGAMVYLSHDTEEGVVGPVAPKINFNNVFADGKITTSDSWLNLWNIGQNEYLGWGSQTSGNGAASLGKMLSETKQVRTCLSQRSFETVCHRKPISESDQALVAQISNQFDEDSNMKNVLINSAIACMGE